MTIVPLVYWAGIAVGTLVLLKVAGFWDKQRKG